MHGGPSRETKSMWDLFQQLSEWLSVPPSASRFQQTALFAPLCTVAQKDNSSVCVWGDYNIPVLFSPTALTYKSRVGDTLVAAESNKHAHTHTKKRKKNKTERCFTQRPWESFWLLPKAKGGFNSMDKIKTLTNDGLGSLQRTLAQLTQECNHGNFLFIYKKKLFCSEMFWKEISTLMWPEKHELVSLIPAVSRFYSGRQTLFPLHHKRGSTQLR